VSYDVVAHGAMIADEGRTEAFARAIAARVRPGAVVADVGSGSGIFAMLACRAGASRVYAIESDDIIQVAREAAAANGFSDRIRFFQAASLDVDLPERVDGIVSDLRGALPFFGRGLESMIDARDRWLNRSGGWMIAERDTVWAAPVSSPRVHAPFVTNWDRAFGIDMSPGRDRSTNRYGGVTLQADELPLPAQRWASIEYGTISNPTAHGTMSWTVDRPMTLHGLAAWFDMETVPGLSISNAPGCPDHVYRQVFFPWPAAVTFGGGEALRVRLDADFVNGDYVFSWQTDVIDTADRSNRSTQAFSQSTFKGTPWSLETLRSRAASFVPEPAGWMAVDRRVLELMDGRRSIGELADEILNAFPRLVKNRTDALTRVSQLSARYARHRP
jgi:protein arginine N-methyltransferase 1